MPFHGNKVLTAQTWVQLTAHDALAVRAQNQSIFDVLLQASSANTAPVSSNGSIVLSPGIVLDASSPLSELFPGVSGANKLWAYSDLPSVIISVSHS